MKNNLYFDADFNFLLLECEESNNNSIYLVFHTSEAANQTLKISVDGGAEQTEALESDADINLLLDGTYWANDGDTTIYLSNSDGDSDPITITFPATVETSAALNKSGNNIFTLTAQEETSAESLTGLTDTNISNPINGQILKYNAQTGKWENANDSGGGGGTILYGTTDPTPQQGNNGDMYMKYIAGIGLTALFGKINDAWNRLNLFVEYFWDFTKSLISPTSGVAVSLLDGAQLTANGIEINTNTNYAQLANGLLMLGYIYEVTIASLNISQTSQNNRLFIFNRDSGLVWRGATGKWGVWDSSNLWQESDITTPNFFDNCILKVIIDMDFKWHIYKDDTLVFEPPNAIKSNFYSSGNTLYLGSNSNSCYRMTISALRLYPIPTQ